MLVSTVDGMDITRRLPAGRYIVLDTETTGLDPFVHQPWEVAWADVTDVLSGRARPDDVTIHEMRLPHCLDAADPVSLDIGRYAQRTSDGAPTATPEQVHALWVTLGGLDDRAKKPTIIGSNPGFDQAMLGGLFHRQGLDSNPWYQRPLDIADVAYFGHGLSNDGARPGLSWLADWLALDTPARHSAAGDVVTTVQALLALNRAPVPT